jgi:hypothetical protein
MNLIFKLLKKRLRWEIEIVEIGVVYEAMTPITTVLVGDVFVFPLLGGIVLICHLL